METRPVLGLRKTAVVASTMAMEKLLPAVLGSEGKRRSGGCACGNSRGKEEGARPTVARVSQALGQRNRGLLRSRDDSGDRYQAAFGRPAGDGTAAGSWVGAGAFGSGTLVGGGHGGVACSLRITSVRAARRYRQQRAEDQVPLPAAEKLDQRFVSSRLFLSSPFYFFMCSRKLRTVPRSVWIPPARSTAHVRYVLLALDKVLRSGPPLGNLDAGKPTE
ncbi:hypothetical protein ZIOFF_066388 [Zingiber officinale]|uniref:Uncharacterized protein n=1 Tax=Zingiber officinale TaxID=94328 RepID=A0A8J5KC28_ZINOF|nr:hypothetical protein ZIOFF_066388 [Zingiber officinale]